ncbi:MAG: protein kinase [Acidobacteria bacterium]|nr:protein kinase [Acidobacteriota bacterium]
MTPERWRQIEKLYHATLALPSNERADFLAEACAGDKPLQDEVELLLGADDDAGSFLARPALHTEAKHLVHEQKTMQVGKRINRYQIVSRIGEGGMGEVWLAEDNNLGRQVAIKLLPAIYTGDADRLRRFEQEARAASALNHPNIITVHEIGEVDGLHYLVTEYVKGQTLRQRLTEGRINAVQTLEIAEQIAEALAAAHGAGIIHRDIKPENVMIRRDGYVKVLDFGLAKLTVYPGLDSGSLSQMDTLRAANTNSGVILGTPRYMSPEQARGMKVDSRTDLFSLGTLLYELLTGNPPFTGETLSDVIAAILMITPQPLAEAAPETPRELQTIIGKLLEKKPEQRYQTADELLSDLQECKTDLQISARLEHRLHISGQQTAVLPSTNQPRAAWQTPKVWLTAVLLLGLIGAGAWWLASHKGSSLSAPIIWPVKTMINWRSSIHEGNSDYRFSPNSEFIAFSAARNGRSQIFVNQTGEDHPVQVTNDEWDNSTPIWSPDGRDLAYISSRRQHLTIWRMRAFGGSPILVASPELPSISLRSWSPDASTVYIESNKQLLALDLATGKTRTIMLAEDNQSAEGFSVSPDGKRIAYVRNQNSLWINTIGTQSQTLIVNAKNIEGSPAPVWHPNGNHIFYSSLSNDVMQLFVASLDGTPPQQLTFGESDYRVADVAKAAKGVRILCSTFRDEADLWRVDLATGKEEQLTSDLSFDLWPAVSPNGRTFAYQRISLREPTQMVNLLKSDLVIQTKEAESRPRQLASDALKLAWASDGKQLAFLRLENNTTNIYVVNSEGGKVIPVTQGGVQRSSYSPLPNQSSQPHDFSWAHGSNRIAYGWNDKTQSQMRLVTVGGSNETTSIHTSTPKDWFYCPTWSPTDQQLAFILSSRVKGKATWGLWVAELAKGQTKQVFQSESALRLLGWSESGQELWLAYDKDQPLLKPGYSTIQVSQFSLKQQQIITNLTLQSAYLYNTYLSPNRRFISFTTQQNERDILWIIPTIGGASRKLTSGNEARVYFSSLAWSPDSREIYFGKQVSWQLLSMIDGYK